jgi:hypothetical protein
MSAKIRKMSDQQYAFHCLGCACSHGIPVEGPQAWGWNRSVETPTFTPSILVRWVKEVDGKPLPMVCHSFVTDCQIKFLSDSTHALAGQTVEIPDWED